MNSLRQGFEAFAQASERLKQSDNNKPTYLDDEQRAELRAAQIIKKRAELQARNEAPLFLARCSGLGKLMTGGYGLDESEAELLVHIDNWVSDKSFVSPSLSEFFTLKGELKKSGGDFVIEKKRNELFTKKTNPRLSPGVVTELENWFLHWKFNTPTPRVFDRKILKGNLCEQQGIDLYNSVYRTTGEKYNGGKQNNGILVGEYDFLTTENGKKTVVDIKCSWDDETFNKVARASELPTDKMLYYWQMMAYMQLYGFRAAKVAFCLVDTPVELLSVLEISDGYGVFSHIGEVDRLKTFSFDFDSEINQQIIDRVKICQKFIDNLYEPSAQSSIF